MSYSSPKPIKLVIVIAAAAVMVGIALAVVLNYQANVTTQEESLEEMPDIEVLTPEGIVMQRGETKVIPLEVRIASKEPINVQVVVFSTDSPETAEQETTTTTMSDSDNYDVKEQFLELQQKGFTNGFVGSLDTESFDTEGNNPDGEVTTKTINLTLTAPADIATGDYYFANSVLGDTVTWDSISSSAFAVTIA